MASDNDHNLVEWCALHPMQRAQFLHLIFLNLCQVGQPVLMGIIKPRDDILKVLFGLDYRITQSVRPVNLYPVFGLGVKGIGSIYMAPARCVLESAQDRAVPPLRYQEGLL